MRDDFRMMKVNGASGYRFRCMARWPGGPEHESAAGTAEGGTRVGDGGSVAVVIPTYNAAARLGTAVESVLAQGWGELAIVVVDDGSTDGTAAMVARFGDRVRYVRQERRGVSAARNVGLRATAGEFVAFLDADDVWLPGKLALQMPEFADPAVGLVYSDFSLRREDGRDLASYLPSYLAERPLAGEGWVLERYLRSQFLFPSTVVARRRALERAGLFHEGLRGAEDLELFARVAAHWKVAWRREVLTARVEGRANLSSDGSLMLEGKIAAFRSIAQKEPGISAGAGRALRGQLGQHLWWSGCRAMQQGDGARARREFLEALRVAPGRSLWNGAGMVGSKLLRLTRAYPRCEARGS